MGNKMTILKAYEKYQKKAGLKKSRKLIVNKWSCCIAETSIECTRAEPEPDDWWVSFFLNWNLSYWDK